jgi:hypothetical protein
MSAKSRSQLYTEINTNLADNNTEAITPALLRAPLLDMVDSSFNSIDSASQSQILASIGAINNGINSIILGSPGSIIANGVTNSTIIGGSNISVTQSGITSINGQIINTGQDLPSVLSNGNTTGGNDIIISSGDSISTPLGNGSIQISEGSFGAHAGKINLQSQNDDGKFAGVNIQSQTNLSTGFRSTASSIQINASDIQIGHKWPGSPLPKPTNGYSYFEVTDGENGSNTWYSGTSSSSIVIQADSYDSSSLLTTQQITPAQASITSNNTNFLMSDGDVELSDISTTPEIQIFTNISTLDMTDNYLNLYSFGTHSATINTNSRSGLLLSGDNTQLFDTNPGNQNVIVKTSTSQVNLFNNSINLQSDNLSYSLNSLPSNPSLIIDGSGTTMSYTGLYTTNKIVNNTLYGSFLGTTYSSDQILIGNPSSQIQTLTSTDSFGYVGATSSYINITTTPTNNNTYNNAFINMESHGPGSGTPTFSYISIGTSDISNTFCSITMDSRVPNGMVIHSSNIHINNTSNLFINGLTAFSGTFSGGGSHVVTVTNGIITSIT